MTGINILAVSKRLEYASVDIMLGVYAHLLKELEDQEWQNHIIVKYDLAQKKIKTAQPSGLFT